MGLINEAKKKLSKIKDDIEIYGCAPQKSSCIFAQFDEGNRKPVRSTSL